MLPYSLYAVSYTHLDVYKRQIYSDGRIYLYIHCAGEHTPVGHITYLAIGTHLYVFQGYQEIYVQILCKFQ